MITKKRHGCVTAWLILMIIINSLTAVLYLIFGSLIQRETVVLLSDESMLFLGVIGLLNVVFAIMLLKWKKWAFWGFLITSMIVFGHNLILNIGMFSSILGLLGIVLLFAILQIKEDGVKAWDHLD